MEIEQMTIKQFLEFKEMFSKNKTKPKKVDRGICIVILQRGWVMVGHLKQKGHECVLEKASVIRSWGTSNGLGEIVLNGPTSSTKLDKCGFVRFHELTSIAIMECNKEKWESKLI